MAPKSQLDLVIDHLNDLTGAVNGMAIATRGTQDRLSQVEDRVSLIHKDMVLRLDSLDSRIQPVEQAQKTLPQKVGTAGALTAKYGAYITAGVVVLTALEKQFPGLGQFVAALKQIAGLGL